MSREILVITPENIEIEYELAGVGTRFQANLLDSLYQLLAFIVLGIFGMVIFGILGFISTSVPAIKVFITFLQSIGTALITIVFFILMWGYFIYFEIAWNGQTPGKRQLGLRVLRDGGYPVNPFAVISRNLLRVVDGMPWTVLALVIIGQVQHQLVVSAIGAASILITLLFLLFSGKYQRLGDFVAGTMVVKQRAPKIASAEGIQGTKPARIRFGWSVRSTIIRSAVATAAAPTVWLDALAPPPRVLPEHLAPYALKDIGRHVYEMTVPEYRAIRHAIDRRWQLPVQIQQLAAMWLAVPLMKRLGITPPPGVQRINYADLLEYLAVAFEQYRGVK